MAFPDLVPLVNKTMPELRGRLLANQPLAELTWFRVGGPAQLLFMPEDEADLCYFLARLPAELSVTVIGLGSNLIVRDGGVPGVVVRLGRGFNGIVFRAQPNGDGETVYLRFHKSGLDDAQQYAPVFKTSAAWQAR